jgi:hypothetical protein
VPQTILDRRLQSARPIEELGRRPIGSRRPATWYRAGSATTAPDLANVVIDVVDVGLDDRALQRLQRIRDPAGDDGRPARIASAQTIGRPSQKSERVGTITRCERP